MLRLPLLCVLPLLLAPCAALGAESDWQFDDEAEDIRATSCEGAKAASSFAPLPLSVTQIDIGAFSHDRVSLAGAWALSSEHKHFGGLSGLNLLDNGDLLAVGDTGRFVKIRMQDGAPTGASEIADMRFENPLIRPGKLTADAEGLSYRNGIALVSFERHFRILGFDLRTCGGAARGITVAKPPRRYDRDRIKANSGPEALSLHPDGTLTLGYEQPRKDRTDKDRAVTARIQADGTATLAPLSAGRALPDDFRLVGLDTLETTSGDVITAELLRAYDRETGNRSIIILSPPDGSPETTLKLAPPMTVDNFEGVALQRISDGTRIFIISDDNFSETQQTLLYAFDLTDRP